MKRISLMICSLIVFHGFAQSQNYDIEALLKNPMIINSPVWDELHQLKMMSDNFPSMDQSVNQRVAQIYQMYSLKPQQPKNNPDFSASNKMMGYDPPPSQADIQEKINAQISGKPPELTPEQQRQKKMQELFAEINSIDNQRPVDPEIVNEIAEIKKRLRIADTNSADYKTYLAYYSNAYNEIVKMLEGKNRLDLKRAVFLVENAFHKNSLSYKKYCRQIDELASICRQIMLEEKLDPAYYMACHYAIQKLFSEKFSYKNAAGKVKTFEPFSYDFIDIFGSSDHTKGFVTKLLDTKVGQCHSMPLLYLIIANELNASAYLALAPNHSYIKFGNPYQSSNFETTNGTFTSDEWIVASGYISPTAIKNRIYLAPLSQDKVIAECLIDLEEGFDFLFGKSEFGVKCAKTTLKYFPNSIGAILTLNNILVARCAQTASKYGFPDYKDYSKYPDLKSLFDAMVEFELQVEQTGYMKIPKGQYERWQQTANEEKQRREHQKMISKLQETANDK